MEIVQGAKIMQGMIVNPKAGHDKNRFYIVMNTDANYAYIADGKRRKLEKLKRKSFHHLNKTNMVLDVSLLQTNLKIRRALHHLNVTQSPSQTREV